MSRITQHQVVSTRWYAGLFALGLFVFIHLQPVFIATAIWLAQHGHGHKIAIQSDGNHFDVRLSHQSAADHHHESSLDLLGDLFSTHDHDGTDHVLHFMLGEAPDQIRQRNIITATQTYPSPIAITAINSIFTPLISINPAAATATESPPPLSAGMLGLRTTVLLI